MSGAVLYGWSGDRFTEVCEPCLQVEPGTVQQKAEGRGEKAERSLARPCRRDLVDAGSLEGVACNG